jgi:hypothetical protein
MGSPSPDAERNFLMSRIELTIDAEYLADGNRWNAAAGIREFMQNGRDAEIEQKAALTVSHYVDAQERGVLVIENEGAVLPKNTLLLGRSSKRENQEELAGKYGEGYKLGSLALLRAGYEVRIRNGGEVWTPAIEASERFEGAKVLVFNIASGRAERNRVRVEIVGVSSDSWKALRENYLFLYKREIKSVKTSFGTLLLGDKWKGRVYVKDILVTTDTTLEYGYNLADAELDRDRQMIESYDRNNRLARLWSEAVAARPDLFEEFYGLLQGESSDVDGLSRWNSDRIAPEISALVAERFQAQFGEGAVPVRNLAESADVEHLGVRGIVVKDALLGALKRTLGDAETVKERLKDEIRENFSWSDLSAVERANLESGIALVGFAVEASLSDIDVVSFRSVKLMGLFKDGRVVLARKMLSSRKDTLEVLVHEFAHRKGIDGDKGHVAEIERIWATVVESLRG